MGKINLLDKNIAELIAAGEVIERPASIVKELLENSIDAGATAVTVELRRGGIGYLRVTDNGSGMEPEDVPVAFLRHATSKIRQPDDLNFISTLGFRGEALASIAAVSRLELTTKTRGSPMGVSLAMEGGEAPALGEAGCADGTTIIARDLFYNVPARLKFLHKDAAEANAAGGVVDKLALSHPEVSIKLIIDHKTRLLTPGDGSLLSAAHAVFGGEFSDSLLPVDYGVGGNSVKGFISAASYSRNTRSMQHFFVNGRYVRSKTCMAALEDSYKNSIMVGKYPCCLLHITVPLETVDVNVSPSKTEVRFLSDKAVFDALYFAVKSALSRDDILKRAAEPTPSTQVENLLSPFRGEEAEQEALSRKVPEPAYSAPASPRGLTLHSPEAEYKISSKPELPAEEFQFLRPEMLRFAPTTPSGGGICYISEEPKEEAPSEPEPVVIQGKETPPLRVLGELLKTYVLFEAGENLLLLDKHAAHERILYEKLKKSVSTEERQLLLKPLVVTVSPEERQALLDNGPLLEQMGFSCEDFGSNAILLREVPLLLAEFDTADILLDIARKLGENRRELASEAYENLLHSIACRAAIKANDATSLEELSALVKQVYEDGEIRHCPHGRPVAVVLSRLEIEKRFGRIQ